MQPEEKGKIEKLNENLYSRNRYHEPKDSRPEMSPGPESSVEEKWKSPDLDEILAQERLPQEMNPTHPYVKKVFIFAVLFFIATLIVAGVIFLGGANFVSSKNVEITVVGATTSSAGAVVDLGITFENNNNTDLEGVTFTIQYPDGSRSATDSAQPLTFGREEIGSIPAGDEASRNVRFILLGATGDVKQLKFQVSYKVKGSNATFYKDKLYEVTIGEAPLSLSIESPSSVTAGDNFVTKVTLNLNSTDILKNVMLRAEYPYGYSTVSSEPASIVDNNVWALGDLTPGAKKTVEIQGKLVGENQEERTFRFYVGVSDSGSFAPNFKTVIVSTQKTVAIERPSLGLNVSFNNDSSPIYVAPAGQNINTSVKFQNNLPDKIIHPHLEVKLSGAALNRYSILAQDNGFYDSANNRIIWELTNLNGQPELSTGEGGRVSFNFSSLAQNLITSANRDILLTFSITGTPTGTSKAITVSETRTVKIASQVNLTAKAFYSIGPFKNTGPIPPKVEKETTYAVVWNIGNTQDDIADAKVTAKLGQGVKWVTSKSTVNENITYDEQTNTVTWMLGNLSSGSGFSTAGRDVAFQVALTPSIIQIGTVPNLVTGISFSGVETTTGKPVTTNLQPLTTRLTSDPAFIQGDDIVVK